MTDDEIPDAVASCGRCGEMFSEGGGTVSVKTFDGSAPECGSRLCPACYRSVFERVADYLFGGVE